MTGYAARTRELERGALNIELKSVNSRVLDFQFRICDELRSVEPALRELFSSRITRGKLECRVGFSAATTKVQPLALNGELLQRLKAFEAQVRSELPQAAPLAVSDVLRWPGMFGDDTLDVDTLMPACLALAKEALEDFAASRAREGEKLVAVILERVARMRVLVREVAPSQRNLGGADLYLKVPGEAEPLHVLAEGQRPAAYPLKSQVRLQPEVGRWWGRWGRLTSRLAPASR
jgi:uncharacterized protein (TIGR00255 family)